MKVSDILARPFPLFKAAYEIASAGHKDDKRKDGKPYMTHIDAVIIESYQSAMISGLTDDTIEDIICVAALHDLIEDHPDLYDYESISYGLVEDIDTSDRSIEVFRDLCLTYGRVDKIMQSVQAITKCGEPYDQYVARVFKDEYARRVKLEDIDHNMSDLKPSNLLAKYQLTKWVLSREYIHPEYKR